VVFLRHLVASSSSYCASTARATARISGNAEQGGQNVRAVAVVAPSKVKILGAVVGAVAIDVDAR
jgi:hypothetical protein